MSGRGKRGSRIQPRARLYSSPPSFYVNFTYVPLTCCLANFLPRFCQHLWIIHDGVKTAMAKKRNSHVHRIFPRTRLFIELYMFHKKEANNWNFDPISSINRINSFVATNGGVTLFLSILFRNHHENTTILDSCKFLTCIISRIIYNFTNWISSIMNTISPSSIRVGIFEATWPYCLNRFIRRIATT